MNFKLKTSQYCWICVLFFVGYSHIDAQLGLEVVSKKMVYNKLCLLYTSDAADE